MQHVSHRASDEMRELRDENDKLRAATKALLRLVRELTGDRTSGMEPVKMANEALYG